MTIKCRYVVERQLFSGRWECAVYSEINGRRDPVLFTSAAAADAERREHFSAMRAAGMSCTPSDYRVRKLKAGETPEVDE